MANDLDKLVAGDLVGGGHVLAVGVLRLGRCEPAKKLIVAIEDEDGAANFLEARSFGKVQHVFELFGEIDAGLLAAPDQCSPLAG